MTRKRYQNLKRALCTRIWKNYSGNKKGMGIAMRKTMDLTYDRTQVSSYDQAWELLKPAREIVGM